jgi:rubrerythrin
MKPNAKTTSHSFQCIDALEVSLSIEKQGFIFYDKAAKSAVDPRVQAIFLRLADEEKEHIQSLQNTARFLQPALIKKSFPNTSKAENFIKNELEGRVFPTLENDRGEVKSDLEALNIGIEAEKRSIEVLVRLITDEKKMDVRVIFNHLLAEERKHLSALEELKQTLAKK